MPYISPEVILEAKKMDLLTYLQSYEPHELVRVSGNIYCTRRHDSLKISNGKWMWHSRGIGGRSALDYLIKVRDMRFTDAVEHLMDSVAVTPPAYLSKREVASVSFTLPERDNNTSVVERYLRGRGISSDVLRFCIDNKLIYQNHRKGERGGYYNAVFVGHDTSGTPR
ncbi:MAG: DUF3991 domain-containing protein [Oscillospiraceae bacterium]|jgi:hypothetical protein|nr:DUF3991 domain-containing protein [Oscillospiraceae bacterium]